jgi:hypothetical protein
MLANFGVDLQEGDFSCSPASSPTHPFVIACRNMAHNKDQPSDGVSSVSTHGQPEGRPPGQVSCHLEPAQHVPSLYRHLMSLNPQSSFLGSHSTSACCKHLTTCFMGILMGMGWTKSQSHHQFNNGGFRPEPWSAKAHSSPWPPKSQPFMVFDVILSLWFELLLSSLPSTSNISSWFLQCHYVWLVLRS